MGKDLHHHIPTPIARIISLGVLLVIVARLVGVVVAARSITCIFIQLWHPVANSAGATAVHTDSRCRERATVVDAEVAGWVVDNDVWCG